MWFPQVWNILGEIACLQPPSAASLSASRASRALANKLDRVPFSLYHMMVILALGLVGFVEGYDLALSGTLLVLARAPLHELAPEFA